MGVRPFYEPRSGVLAALPEQLFSYPEEPLLSSLSTASFQK
jgi:hypothetical protein